MPNSLKQGDLERSYGELERFIQALPEKKGSLIAVLHKAQEIFGYLPPEVQEFVAEKLNLPLAKVYGVVSFYSFFTMQPKGKHAISVCMGTACYVRGADKVLDEFKRLLSLGVGECTPDGKFFRCSGVWAPAGWPRWCWWAKRCTAK